MGNTLKFILEYREYINNILDVDNDQYIYNEISKRSKFGSLVILEGLIKTHPNDKSSEILKRRFPELIIEIEEDGELFIENQPPKPLSKYLPIITNLGYFISIYTIDGNVWLKDYTDDTKPIAFKIEPKYDYEVDIPNILYHTSPIKFKHKILKNGLSPRSGNKLTNHPERIYLLNDIEKSIMFGNYLSDENDWYENGYCIYSIDGDGISNLYSDINFREGGFYTTNNISASNIKLIEEFKL